MQDNKYTSGDGNDPAWLELLGVRNFDRPAALGSWPKGDEPVKGAELYYCDPGLEIAVKTAVALAQPLLVTGQPGVGKTMLGRYVAWKLGLDRLRRFDTKSTSTATDLFYTVDTLGWFHAANIEKQQPEKVDPLQFIQYQALGRAILQSAKPEDVKEFLRSEDLHKEPQLSVVLIDEIDKAPRDFPNDLLAQLEYFYFEVPELARKLAPRPVRIKANPDLLPVVVITSNSEKALPDAFLRRCIYYDIPFPNWGTLVQIVERHFESWLEQQKSDLVRDAVRVVMALSESKPRKAPSTAELIAFGRALRACKFGAADRLEGRIDEWRDLALATLLKTKDDRDAANAVLTAVDWKRPLGD